MVLISSLLLIGAYQFSFIKIISLDQTRDKHLLINYYQTEYNEKLVYRWTHPNSSIKLPRVGQLPKAIISLELLSRPAPLPTADVQVTINSTFTGSYQIVKPSDVYIIEYNAENRSIFSNKNSEFDIWLHTEPSLAKGDPRPFGVVVSGIKIEGLGLFQTGRPVIPDWQLLMLILTSATVLFLLGQRVGWSQRTTALGVGGLVLIVAFGLVQDRITVGAAAPLILEAILLSYLFIVLGIYVVKRRLTRLNLPYNQNAARWLACIFVLAFIIRAIGINHPSFQVLDHGFRINEIRAIQQDPTEIFKRYYSITTFEPVGGEPGRSVAMGQWNLKVSIPYTPLFYIVSLPIAELTTDNRLALLHWINIFAVWLDVSALFLIYLLARQTAGRYGNTAGLVGATLFCFFPVSYLMVSDGGFNNLLSTWLVLAWLVGVTGWFTPAVTVFEAKYGKEPIKKPRWSSVIGVGLLMALAMLGHTATFLMFSTMFALYLILIFLVEKGRYRYLLGRIGTMVALGLGLSFVTYYGFYFIPLLTQTLPTMLGQVSSGKVIGEQTMSLHGFFPALTSHFHLLPFFATAGIFGWLGLSHLRRFPSNYTNQVVREIKALPLLLYIAWFLSFLCFAAIAGRINLVNKDALFAQPLLALGTGLALAVLIDYFRYRSRVSNRTPKNLVLGGQLLLVLIVIWFIAAGSYTWYIRSIHYILPAGTG